MKSQKSQLASASENSNKRIYQKPQLEVYGNLEEVTRTASPHGGGDGGHPNPGRDKSHTGS